MSKQQRIGVWIVGARGSVALCTLVGAAAMKAGRMDSTGMVSALAPFESLGLADPGRLVFGGHDIRDQSLVEAAREFHTRSGLLTTEQLRAAAPLLRKTERNLRPGFTLNGGPRRPVAAGVAVGKRVSPAKLVERVRKDIEAFRAAHRLDRVIVVHLSSTEAPAAENLIRMDLGRFRRRLAGKTATGFTASLIYGYAALEMGAPFINFTPSPAAETPALAEMAALQGMPVAGNDGKTGETLLKTVLAPMFAARNLKLRTWYGYNLLGNRDGEALAEPHRRISKLRSKDAALARIVNDPDLASKVTIDYAPSLHDWKTAWDFIHFEGFLGARMSLQFSWHGSDSALAAPLVLDLVRFADLAARREESGPLAHLACFFKSPLGTDEQDFQKQFGMLLGYAERAGAKE